MLIFVAGQLWPGNALQAERPASQTQARLVNRLCVDRLPVHDRLSEKGCVFSWKSLGLVVLK